MIGLMPLVLRRLVEGDRAVEGAVVGDRHRIHAQLGRRVDQLRDPAETVEQAEFGVDVEVREVVRGDGHREANGSPARRGRTRPAPRPVPVERRAVSLPAGSSASRRRAAARDLAALDEADRERHQPGVVVGDRVDGERPGERVAAAALAGHRQATLGRVVEGIATEVLVQAGQQLGLGVRSAHVHVPWAEALVDVEVDDAARLGRRDRRVVGRVQRRPAWPM